jgi:hypothetical protein
MRNLFNFARDDEAAGHCASADDNAQLWVNDPGMDAAAAPEAPSGGVLEPYSYMPYGTAPGDDGESCQRTLGPGEGQARQFDGYVTDAETGASLARVRACHPLLSDWMDKRPFAYVGNGNGEGTETGT